jgi:hypothetical protein
MKNKSVAMMAFASGSESKDRVKKLYIGVAPVFIVGVNPNKAEYEKLFNRTLDDAPVYIGEGEVGPEGDRVKVPQIRIDFIVKTDAEKCGVELTDRITFFLSKAMNFNRDRSKVEVINKYGESTYLPIACVEGTEPIPDNMKWYDTSGMRPTYIGEADLTAFIKAFLNIPSKSYRKGNEVVFIKNLADAEAKLDKIESYFRGDISELKSVINLQPNNRVKTMFGVRTTDDNNQYQAVYTKKFLKNMVNDYSKLDEDLQARKNAGAYPTVEFLAEPIKEYTVESTDFSSPANDPLGAKSAPANAPWAAWNK